MIAVQWVWLAGLAFFVTHLGVSSTGLRGVLQARLGAQGYLGLYSAFAFVTLALLIFTYTHTPHAPLTWLPLYAVPKLVMPVALFFIVGGFTVPNPTAVGAEKILERTDAARGVLRITRHPFLWATALWSGAHLLVTGHVAAILFFGTLLVTALRGTGSIDEKRRRTNKAEFERYLEITSNLPFAAIIQGKNRLAWSELWVPSVIAALLLAVLLKVHLRLFGFSPFG